MSNHFNIEQELFCGGHPEPPHPAVPDEHSLKLYSEFKRIPSVSYHLHLEQRRIHRDVE